MALRYPTVDGRVCVAQVAPPLLVATTTPGAYATPAIVPPTATQFIADAQEMPLRNCTLAGIVWVSQVAPPFLVAMTAEPEKSFVLPTATQSFTDEHEMPRPFATKLVTFEGAFWMNQEAPPLVVAAVAIAVPNGPAWTLTATQSFVDGQETPLKLPRSTG